MPKKPASLFNRALPSNLEAERSILGAVLLDNATLPQAIQLLETDDFHPDSHKRTYRAMLRLFARGSAIDPILLAQELQHNEDLDFVGGQAFIGQLIDGVPRFSNIEDYCLIVRERSNARKLITTCNHAINELFALEESIDVAKFLNRSLTEVAARNAAQKSYKYVGEVIQTAIDSLNDQIEDKQRIAADPTAKPRYKFFRTGFQQIDLALGGGIRPRKYVVVAARTSKGKSTIVLQFALNAVLRDPETVGAYFSLEMPDEELGHRVLSTQTGIHDVTYKTVSFNEAQARLLRETRDSFKDSNLAIYTQPKWTPSTMIRAALELKEKHKRLDYVICDYISLFESDEKHERRHEAIAEISRQFKLAADILDCPVITPAQLKPEVDGREGSFYLRDIAESAAIAKDADIVFLLQDQAKSGSIIPYTIDAAKVRGGRKFTTKLNFDSDSGRFLMDYARIQTPDEVEE